MNRRSFFRTVVGGVATAAAIRQWPFRVYSFPTQPILAPGDIIIPFSNYFLPGQKVAIYGSNGLEKGCYRVKRIDVNRRIYLSYEDRLYPLRFQGISRSYDEQSSTWSFLDPRE